MTGASGVIYGKRLLEVLKGKNEIHLIISRACETLIEYELKTTKKELEGLADFIHREDDFSSPLASGSFIIDAAVIIPCSMKTLAGIAHGYSENLILRAADVTLKERRKLILVPRETPLSPVHLRNLLQLSKQGVFIVPAMPAFYSQPKTVEEMVDFVVGKVLDALGLEHQLYTRWHGDT